MKSRVKRVLSWTLVFCLCLTMLPTVVLPAQAASYNASAAVSYANSHWNDGVGLCAEFVSKCLAAGGVTIPNSASYYSSSTQSYNNNSGTLGVYTNPYTCSASLLLYLSKYYTVITNPDSSQIDIGDVVFMHSGERDGHVGIIINKNNGTPTYAAHNRATNTGKFYSNYPCTYVVKMNGLILPVTHTKDSSYGTNFTAYPKTKITAENIFDAYHNQIDSTSWIGTSDKCTIHEVYTDGCCKVTYPLDAGGTKTVYSKISLFITPHTHSYTGTRVYESAHPHRISQRCVDYATCGGYIWTDEYYEKNTCEQCWYVDFDIGASSISIMVGESKTVSASLSGCLPDSAGLLVTDTDVVDVTIKDRQATFTGLKAGTVDFIFEVYSDTSKSYLIGATSIRVNVTAPALSVNSTNSAVVSTGGEMKYFTFTPTTSGKYVIYSTGSEDTKVYLYNASGTELDSDDDDGDSNNFRLEYNLTAGTKYTFGVKYYNSSKTGTISFKFGNVYTITYNANGGSGIPSAQSKDYGTSITLSSTTPTRTGYTFLGWATSSTATSATYQPGATYTANSSTTLYAVWKKVFYGDVNQDGVLDNNDILRMNKIRLDKIQATNWELFAGDLDGDGSVTMDDIELLSAFILRQSTQFPVEQMKKTLMINTYPDKTDYCVGTQISTKGLSIILYYADTYECYYVTEYCDIVLPSTSSAGQKNVDISFEGLNTQYQVTITSEHSYTYKTTKTPTTSATGTLTGTCSKCSGTTTVTLPKLNTTDYSYSIRTAATCTGAGSGRYTWKTTTYGSFYFDVTIPATGHSYTNQVTAPTCTAQGYTTHTCSCGHSYKDSYTSATGHSYSYKASKEPTFSATGTLTGTCSKCSGTTTVTLPKLTTTDYNYTVTKAATCTATGTGRYTWKTTTYGSFYFDTTIIAAGHLYTHKVTAPSCTAQGYTTHTCSKCSNSYKDGYTNALGHAYSNGNCTRCGAEDPNYVATPSNAYDVSKYRSGETYTAPVKEGYVFAGWYVDAAMTVPLGEEATTGTAYAKFVDEDVLSVKWQLSSGTTTDSAKTALRVLTTVDALSYSRVGFTVEAPGKETKELTSKTVYETIYGYTGSNNESYKPTIFAHTSKYFMAHTLSGIPQSDFTKQIKVTPKWTTLDGTEVTGKPLTIRIIDAIGG